MKVAPLGFCRPWRSPSGNTAVGTLASAWQAVPVFLPDLPHFIFVVLAGIARLAGQHLEIHQVNIKAELLIVPAPPHPNRFCRA